jgi:hypothetical protein
MDAREGKSGLVGGTVVGGSYEKDAHAGRELHGKVKVHGHHPSGLRKFGGGLLASFLKRGRF